MNRIVTITSNWGVKDAYTAIFKASLWRYNPNVSIVDITHQIAQYNVSEAAFQVLQSVPFFADDTIHIIDVENLTPEMNVHYNRWLKAKNAVKDFYFTDYIAFRMYNQYFMCQNNGLASLIVPDDDIEDVVLLESVNDKSSRHLTFSALDYYAYAAAILAREGATLKDIGKPYELKNIQTYLNTQAVGMADGNTISAQIRCIDSYGNIITNLHKSCFERIAKGRKWFEFTYANSNEITRSQVTKGYQRSVSRCNGVSSDVFFVFGVSGYLEIGYRNDSLAQLYGLENAGFMNGNFYFKFLDE